MSPVTVFLFLLVAHGHCAGDGRKTEQFDVSDGVVQFLQTEVAVDISGRYDARRQSLEQHHVVPSDTDVPIVHVMYATTMESTGPGDSGLMASMLSLSQNLKSPHRAVIHLVVPEEDIALASEFQACFQRQFELSQQYPHLELHKLLPLPFEPGENPHTKYLTGNTMTYTRWLAPEYLPDVDRLLYVDTDTLVLDDVRSLFQTELNNGTVLMLKKEKQEAWGSEGTQTLKEHYVDSGNGFSVPTDSEDFEVHNAGISLYDLAQWKAVNLTGALIAEVHSSLEVGSPIDDQLILNIVVQRMQVLEEMPDRFNVEGLGAGLDIEPISSGPVAILHFAGPVKQWDPGYKGCELMKRYLPRTQCPSLLSGSASTGLAKTKSELLDDLEPGQDPCWAMDKVAP